MNDKQAMWRHRMWTYFATKKDDELVQSARRAMNNAKRLLDLDCPKEADNERRFAGEIHAFVNARRPYLVASVAQELS